MKRLWLVGLLAVVSLACGDDGDRSESSTPTTPTTSSSLPTTTAPSTTATTPAGPPPPLKLTQVATFEGPTGVALRPGSDDLYVTEQIGRVQRLADFQPQPEPVLDISSQVTAGGEQGLLGLAFSPDGRSLFVAFTNKAGDQELDRFAVDETGSRADPASGQQILVIPDFAGNHNGGALVFGPDGYLYWAMGDGGGAGDPQDSGQDPSDLLGNIVRIDPLRPGDGGTPYAIPPDNPFVGGGGAPEVYAYGLRNPWRISFDRATTDLWIADVGQSAWEEINLAPASEGRGRGANFGWSELEGTQPFREGSAPAGATAPVYEYARTGERCSVTGGYVYRGTKIPQLAGNYLFGDYCGGDLEALRIEGGQPVVAGLGLNVPNLSTFAEDAEGELYALSLQGDMFRIEAA